MILSIRQIIEMEQHHFVEKVIQMVINVQLGGGGKRSKPETPEQKAENEDASCR